MDTNCFSKTGSSNVFDDKKPVSNIACGNKTSTSTFDKLIPDTLTSLPFKVNKMIPIESRLQTRRNFV